MNRSVRLELDGSALADELFRAYLKQILIDGFFHADPHPGNVFMTHDGRIALLDLGMVARIAPGMQESLLKLLLAVSEGDADRAAQVGGQIGRQREDFDADAFRRREADLVGGYQQASLGDLRIGRTLLELATASNEAGLQLPTELCANAC